MQYSQQNKATANAGMTRRSFVRVLGVTGAALMAGSFSLFGCSAGNSNEQTADQQAADVPETREVTDLAGNTITVPGKLESVIITSWKGAMETLMILGHEDLIHGMSDTTRYSWLRKVYPDLVNIPDYGNFDDVNVEEIVKANPDIVFAPQAGSKAIPQMQELGLPVYVDGVTTKGDPYEGRDAELLALAELVGEEERANSFLAWEKKWLDEVANRVSDIPDAERKTALCLRNNTTEIFNCKNILGLTPENAGGVNVAKDAGIEKFYGDVSAEEIVKWNPDFIFQYTVQGTLDGLVTRYQEMKDDARFAGMSALESGDFYIMPQAIANWGGKMESALGALLMGKIMYPEKFSDIVIKDVAEDYYRNFLNRDLTADDWTSIAKTATGAKELPLT